MNPLLLSNKISQLHIHILEIFFYSFALSAGYIQKKNLYLFILSKMEN